MKTTIDLDDRLLASARARAADRKTTLSRIVQEAVRAYLAMPHPEAVVEPFVLVTAGIPGGSFPSPAQVHELLAEEESASAD